jgi:actin-related protein
LDTVRLTASTRLSSAALQAEILFETFNAPAIYLARQPVLAALSAGRASAIVIDMGHTATRVAPVYDGYVLNSESSAAGLRRVADWMRACPDA